MSGVCWLSCECMYTFVHMCLEVVEWNSVALWVPTLSFYVKDGCYWVIQRSWFARVNALCKLSCKKLREVAAHFRANIVAVAKITVERGWRVEKSVFASFFGWPEDCEFVEKCILGHPIAWATSYCLFPDTLWLRASKNAFNVGSVKFANSLSLPSTVKKVCTGSKSSQGT